MDAGIYIFSDETAFLNAMSEIAKLYKQKTDFIRLNKHINNLNDVEKEINFLKRCQLTCFNGFSTSKLIKVSIIGFDGGKYHITYSFNNAFSSGAYGKLNRYLKKRSNIYI